jgi:hypothetical protein
MPAPRRSVPLGTLLVTLLLAAGCGTTEPAPLEAVQPEVPADLCATVPAATRQGLIANSNSDEGGNPTAACSLRSADGAATQVRAVVTWVQTNDDATAEDVLGSQCRAIDRSQFKEQNGFRAAGADKACAASGRIDGADSATLAAVAGREVFTVRLSSLPPGDAPALGRATDMLEGVIGSLAGSS